MGTSEAVPSSAIPCDFGFRMRAPYRAPSDVPPLADVEGHFAYDEEDAAQRERYTRAWSTLNRRRRVRLVALVAQVALGLIVFTWLALKHGSAIHSSYVVAALVMVTFVCAFADLVMLGSTECPRCHACFEFRFSEMRESPSACVNCGLPRNAPPPRSKASFRATP